MPTSYGWVGSQIKSPTDTFDAPVGLGASSADEWFGSMVGQTKPCRPRRSLRGHESGRFLVLHHDLQANDPTFKAILSRADKAIAYRAIPLIDVACREKVALDLAGLPGVRAVLPAFEGIDDSRRVVAGIDFLVWSAWRQFSSAPSRELFGGRNEGDLPGYPVIRLHADTEGNTLEADPQVLWRTRPALIPIINISLGTWELNYPFTPNNIVNVATHDAATRGLLVVVAAGNCGKADRNRESMSAWAEAPWVLSVGATEDEKGTTLADYSSKGVRDDPDSGPDVVAYGRSTLSPYPEGTSFAAPRVSLYGMICAAAMLELRHAFQVASGEEVQGV